jgi:hypothetical protein
MYEKWFGVEYAWHMNLEAIYWIFDLVKEYHCVTCRLFDSFPCRLGCLLCEMKVLPLLREVSDLFFCPAFPASFHIVISKGIFWDSINVNMIMS